MTFAAATGGFVAVDVSELGVYIDLIDYTGTVLHSIHREQFRSSSTSGTQTGKQTQNDKGNDKSSNGGKQTQSDTGFDLYESQKPSNGKNSSINAASNDLNLQYKIMKSKLIEHFTLSNTEIFEITSLCIGLISLIVLIFIVKSSHFDEPLSALISSSKKKSKSLWEISSMKSTKPNSQDTNTKDENEPKTKEVPAPSDSDSINFSESNLTRKQYYTARREALAKSREGRRRSKPHPVILNR